MGTDKRWIGARLERIRAHMRGAGIDVLALAPSDNLRYATGFSPIADERFCVLLVTADAEAFVIPSLNADQAAAALPGLPIFDWKDNETATTALDHAIGRLGIDSPRQVAVDPEMRAETLLTLLQATPAMRAINGAPLMRAAREVKEPDEIHAIARSATTADRAMRAAIAACRPGVAELEVAAAVHTAFRQAGVEHVCFACIASGPNSGFPHHESSDRVIRAGDAVAIDLGGKLAGYASDITRMVHVGEPSDHYRQVHDTVERALQAALAAAKPGATCGDVDDAARRAIEDAGYGAHLIHRTGHGLGLSTHEPPWIMTGEDAPLQVGMVFSIEPGIYLKDDFGVRLEDCPNDPHRPRDLQRAAARGQGDASIGTLDGRQPAAFDEVLTLLTGSKILEPCSFPEIS